MPTLEWLTRETDVRTAAHVPYRLLEGDPSLSYGDEQTENMLIQGDNLEALKALLPFYAGRVKCIFIDPPYNTRSAFEHYDDNLEHSQWLAMMYPRLEILRELLSEDGSIWMTIDDNEAHYLKVIMDEIFGRNNFVASVIWQKKYSVANDHKTIAPMHDYLLVYRASAAWQRNLVPRLLIKDRQYKFKDSKGIFRVSDYTCNKTSDERPNLYYPVRNPNTGVEVFPSKRRVWAYSMQEHNRHIQEDLIFWGAKGTARIPSFKRYRESLKLSGSVPQTLWLHEFAGHTDEARKEVRTVLDTQQLSDDFLTPKPERLLEQVLTIGSNVGDLMLDSFLGSGTATAVAQKMGRRYIGIEMGEHAVTHCVPRMKKVVDGEQGGISESVGWKDGGGFRFYRLGSPIFDEQGRINPAIRFDHLAAHVWFAETRTPISQKRKRSPFLGAHGETGYYLLFNGILGDKSVDGGNVLTHRLLAELPKHGGPKVIYGEGSRIGASALKKLGITFKQIPYDVKAR